MCRKNNNSKWMMSCQEVSRLLSQDIEKPLPLFKKITLLIHLSMCDACRLVKHQFQSIHTLTSKQNADESNIDHDIKLSDEQKKRLRNKLAEQMKE